MVSTIVEPIKEPVFTDEELLLKEDWRHLCCAAHASSVARISVTSAILRGIGMMRIHDKDDDFVSFCISPFVCSRSRGSRFWSCGPTWITQPCYVWARQKFSQNSSVGFRIFFASVVWKGNNQWNFCVINPLYGSILAERTGLMDSLSSPKDQIVLDLYCQVINQATKMQLNFEQTSAFFSIVKNIHEKATGEFTRNGFMSSSRCVNEIDT